ncbi:hypothetical protein [Ruegeria sp. Ofav3-42]|uniref:hypothetical protein n=1 Tax=Ruegeria sp. Ofav3-42 TaxID=2917759 RepID=UPI001EF60EED|nr:hypothetical protein [Ruegeria sp. Ofav3-42]MCG7518844.1 hypothetical protein [Ruegeria sp. Ofav3-42]
MLRPSFHDLTPDQQAKFGNGLGPFWLPDAVRRFITETASWFFQDASWRHHDFGYAVGGDRWDRARCDWKFLKAMLKDAVTQDQDLGWPAKATTAILVSFIFYLAVRVGGQFGSFEYRDYYATLQGVLDTYR